MKRVYFIKPVGMDGPIKIGCSDKPQGRSSNLETWSPFALEVIATIDAGHGFALEHRFHAAFQHLHQRREWFRPGPDLLACIAAIKAGTFDIKTLPKGKRLDNRRRERAPATPRYEKGGSPSDYRLLREITSFCSRHSIAHYRFGTDAVGDPKLVGELSLGRELRSATLTKVRTFMATYRPADQQAAAA